MKWCRVTPPPQPHPALQSDRCFVCLRHFDGPGCLCLYSSLGHMRVKESMLTVHDAGHYEAADGATWHSAWHLGSIINGGDPCVGCPWNDIERGWTCLCGGPHGGGKHRSVFLTDKQPTRSHRLTRASPETWERSLRRSRLKWSGEMNCKFIRVIGRILRRCVCFLALLDICTRDHLGLSAP